MYQQISDLDRAIDLFKSGNRSEAKLLAQLIIKKDPNNEKAWALYSASCTDIQEKASVLEDYLKINPDSQNAKNALIRLLKKQLEVAVHPDNRLSNVSMDQAKKKPNAILALVASVLIFSFVLIIFFLAKTTIQLNQNYQSLESEHSLLLARYDQKQSDLTMLANDYQVLKDQNDQLKNDYKSLESNFNQVSTLYTDLKKKAVVPPYILTKNREVNIAFNRLDKSVETWSVSFDNLEIELFKGYLTRSLAEEPANFQALRFDSGKVQYVEDMTLFVDPTSFEDVVTDLYKQSKSDFIFINEIWNIVTQLTTYSAEIEETPRFPLETFLEGGGDCEDTAILLASMILAAPVDWTVELVYMDADHPTNPQDVNHVIVHIDTGTQQYFIETTSDTEMEPFDEGVTGWYFSVSD